jgi:hypothetical protein
MQLILKILAISGIVGLFILGLSAYFVPALIYTNGAFSWSPDGIAGMSGTRSVIGGHFIGLAAVGIYALIKSKYKLFYIIAVSEVSIAFGRFISLGIDGYDPQILFPLGVELYFAISMFYVAKFLK